MKQIQSKNNSTNNPYDSFTVKQSNFSKMNNNFDNKSQGKMNDTFMSTFIDDANSPDIHILSNCHNCKNNDIEYFKQDIQKYKNVRKYFNYNLNLGCFEKRLKNRSAKIR